jgi:hypothetical protein
MTSVGVMAELAAVAALEARPEEFELVWRDADGAEQRSWLVEAAMIALEQAPSVCGLLSFRGQRSLPGLWWFATTGEHVGYKSWLERDQLMALDADPSVVAVSQQPMWLHWSADGQALRHAPDFFARLADGSAVVIDVRADDQITSEDAVAFATIARACASVGWDYRRVGGLDAVLAANLRWLSGYRHPRCLHAKRAAELQQVFAQRKALLDGAVAVGDPIAVLPVLFHLLWCGRLVTELAVAPIGPESLVRAAERAGRRTG